MSIKASILIPAYNAEKTIADTIGSAINQTWENIEIIVIDDGSSDLTYEVAKQFQSNNLKVVKQQNSGAAAARNHAFRICTGDYIQWLDADDLISPDKIEIQINDSIKLSSPLTLQSCPWGHFMYRYWKADFNRTELWQDHNALEWLILKMGKNLHMQTSTWLVSRELTEIAGPWNEELSLDDDGEYFCRVICASDGIRFSKHPKVFYRNVGSSRLSVIGKSQKKRESLLQSMRLHIKYLMEQEDSERTRKASLNYLQTWYPYYYPDSVEMLEILHAMANSLGGELKAPCFSWKYSWILKLFGWEMANSAKWSMPYYKQFIERKIDYLLYSYDSKNRISDTKKIISNH